jgi:purine-binding chemotaxis protein CheW
MSAGPLSLSCQRGKEGVHRSSPLSDRRGVGGEVKKNIGEKMSLKQFASFYIGDNLFGVDIRLIREINRNIDITPVDSAPDFVRGLLNLRGQIVTVIDVGVRMGLRKDKQRIDGARCIVLKTSEEIASKRSEDSALEDTSRDIVALYVDAIGDMVTFEEKEIEPSPANIGEVEGKFIGGIVKLEKELMIILKAAELLKNEEEHERN